MPTDLLIATNNAHKVDELRQLFADAGVPVTLWTLRERGLQIDPDETGQTFEENAYIKARAVFEATGMAVIADDSGLEVQALENAPGVRSARYAGPDATDAENRQHLREQLQQRSLTTSAARFRCVLCYIDPLRTLFGEGSCDGQVGVDERGDRGFGYDPMFTPLHQERTFAELSPSEKHAISHRGRAMEDLLRHLLPLQSDHGHAVEPDPLPLRDAVVMASVAAATDQTEHLRTAIRLFVRTPHDAQAIYEAMLQSYLFAGFPVALEALAVVDDEVRRILPAHRWPDPEPYLADSFRQRGQTLCQQVYAGVYDRMMQRLVEVTPDLSEWMIVEGYGKTLSRPGLDVVSRELCNVAILAVLQHRNQLVSHVRGTLNVGGTLADLQLCADAVTEWGSAASGGLLREVIDQFRDRVPTYG